MSKSYKRKVRQMRRAKQDDYLKRLEEIYGNKLIERDVFGRRAALPSEIARQIQSGMTKQL